jgi:leader peptidase (prepilin peptidase) / N-methyltransferase
MNTPADPFVILAFIVGASIGSFVNVAAYRMPREISLWSPRSFCPRCRRTIPFWANVPILAYIGLRGRCLACGASIQFRYFLTEAALAVAASYLYLNFALPDAIARFALCAALFVVALIDYDWRVIPNVITMSGIPIGFAAASLLMPEVGWMSSLIGIAIGAGFLFLTGQVYILIRGTEGVGMGDVWLLGMVGGFLGWPGVLFTIFVGSFFGSVGGIAIALGAKAPGVIDEPVPEAIAQLSGAGEAPGINETDLSLMQTAVPFGPFLALAAAIFALFQPQLAHWYLTH